MATTDKETADSSAVLACKSCNRPLSGTDHVLMEGSCKHVLHLSCFLRGMDMGLRGCCTGNYMLGETLEDLLDEPLGRTTSSSTSSSSEVRSVSEVRPGLAGVFDMFGKVDKLLDATMDTSALGNIKNGRPVQTMMAQGVTAEDLLRSDKGTGKLVEWLFPYTARELRMLGFTWDSIVDAGLTVKVVAHKRGLGWPEQDVRSVWGVTWEHIYGKLCQRESVRLAEMQLTPEQWCVFGHKTPPSTAAQDREAAGRADDDDGTFVAFLEQVKFAAADLPLFGFKFEQWAQLGMRQPIQQFNFSTEETRTFVDSCYSLDQDSALAEYKHFFPLDKDVEQIYNRSVEQSVATARDIPEWGHPGGTAAATADGSVRNGFMGARPVARPVRGAAAARGGAFRAHHQHAGGNGLNPRRVGAVLPAARPLFQRGSPRGVGAGHQHRGAQQQQRSEVRTQPARRGGASIGINRQKGRVTLRLP